MVGAGLARVRHRTPHSGPRRAPDTRNWAGRTRTGGKWRIGCRISHRPMASPCVEGTLRPAVFPEWSIRCARTRSSRRGSGLVRPTACIRYPGQGRALHQVHLRSPGGSAEGSPVAAGARRRRARPTPPTLLRPAQRGRNPLVAVSRATVVAFGASAATRGARRARAASWTHPAPAVTPRTRRVESVSPAPRSRSGC
jgi:hypothetical protein